MFAVVLLFLLQGAGAVVPAVSELDPSLYVGRWYQISADALVADTFELKAECVTADYALASDPTYGTIIKLVNSETINGKLFNITGYAYIANESEPAELSVKFDEYVPSFATGSYWVILLGPVVNNQYQYSVVSDSTGLSLFVLARDVADYAENYASTVDAFLADNGYADFFAPIATVQDDCTYAPTLVQASSYCPTSPVMFHAGCDETVTFENSCSDVMAEIVARVGGQYETWSDPHNNGTYAITTQTDSTIQLSRTTGNGEYTDHMNFVFDDGSASCVVSACSESQVTSLYDYGTNHCNLFSLYCGTEDSCPIVMYDLTYTEKINSCTDATTSCVASSV